MSQISQITISPRDFNQYQDIGIGEYFGNIKLYIPHVFPNYKAKDIAFVFERLRIGKVSKVDIVCKWNRQGKKYFAAYIHFQHWFDNTASRNFQAKVLNPSQEARIVYDDPWYWIVLPYKNNKSTKNNTRSVKIYNEPLDIQPTSQKQKLEEFLEAADINNDKDVEKIEMYIELLEKENEAWRLWAASFQPYLNQ